MSDRLRAYLRGARDAAHRVQPPHERQRPDWYFPTLTGRPWHDADAFSWVKRLEAAAPSIRSEMEAVRRARSLDVHPVQPKLVASGSWLTFSLFAFGRRIEKNCARCPETTKVVETIPGATEAGLVYFSALSPHTHVAPHAGPTNTRLRCHLALAVPDGCTLTVGGEERSWEEGRCLVFDDSFEHEARNPTDAWRIVLLVDVWHPELTAHERSALKSVVAEQLARGPAPSSSEAPRPSALTFGAASAFATPGSGKPGADG